MDIDAAIDALKLNPLKGNKIEKDRWPKKYKKEVKINNLFRYPLHNGYRLIYILVPALMWFEKSRQLLLK